MDMQLVVTATVTGADRISWKNSALY